MKIRIKNQMDQQTRQIVESSRELESESNTSAWKLAVLVILGVIFSLLSSYYLSVFLSSDSFGSIWASFGFAAVLVIINILQVLFIKNLWVLRGAVILECVAPVVFFMSAIFPVLFLPLLAAVALYVIFTLIGAGRGFKNLSNSISVQFFGVAKPVAAKFVTGFLIFVSVAMYYQFIELGRLGPETGQFLMNQLLSSTEPALKIQYSGVSFGQTVKQFSDSMAKSVISKTRFEPINDPNIGLSGDLTQLSPVEQNRIADALSINILQSFEKRLGTLNPNESVRDSVFNLVKKWLGKFSPESKQMLAVSGAVLVFFSLRGLSVIVIPIIEFFAFVLFKLLLILGFARIFTEKRDREFITL